MPATAVIAVDVQGTFADDVEGAGLPVPGAARTVDPIRRFTVAAADADPVTTVVTSQDWHPEQLPSHMVARPGDEPDIPNAIFPRHGIAGTPQAELHPRFATPALLAVVTDQVRKGQAAPAFSAFDGTDRDGRPLAWLLHQAGVRRVVVYGWELANCVAATCRSAARHGYDVWLVPELCSVLDPAAAGQVVDDLRRAGVTPVDADGALRRLQTEPPARSLAGGAPRRH